MRVERLLSPWRPLELLVLLQARASVAAASAQRGYVGSNQHRERVIACLAGACMNALMDATEVEEFSWCGRG